MGKTIQTVGVINAVPEIERVLIICPASLKINWHRELTRWLTRKLSVGIADSKCVPTTDIVILNYDIAAKLRPRLESIAWDLLVCDEAHALKNPKAQRTKAILGDKDTLGLRAKRRMFLTGTPIVNKPVELWPLIHALDPERWPHFFKFALRYCGARKNSFGWDFSGATHLDELQLALRSTIMVRRLKKDVLTELPAKRRQIIELPNGCSAVSEEREAMEAWEDEEAELQSKAALALLAEDDAGYAMASEALTKARMVAFTELAKMRHAVALAKLPAVIEHITEQLEAESKLVVFGHHRDVIESIVAAFPGAVKLYGGMSDAEKDASVRKFQSDPACRLFVGGIKAAGVGLTLTAASHVVFAELDWVPGVVSQCEDRCHRIGQAESVLIQHLVLEGSVDARMVKFIVRKQAVIDQALDKGCATLDAQKPMASVMAGSVMDEAPAAVPAPVPVASAELRELVQEGLRLLAGVCDGASKLDGAGFNKFDSVFGKELASRGYLTDKMVVCGKRLVVKYGRQLGLDFKERLDKISA